MIDTILELVAIGGKTDELLHDPVLLIRVSRRLKRQ